MNLKPTYESAFSAVRERITANLDFVSEVESEFLDSYDGDVSTVKQVTQSLNTYDSELKMLIDCLKASRKLIKNITTLHNN